jgi:hypothetical protein
LTEEEGVRIGAQAIIDCARLNIASTFALEQSMLKS